MQVDLSQFLETFYQEAAEHLEEMEAGLLRLEAESAGAESLNSIFRAAHSIKGASGTFGLDDVTRFTHVLESLLDRLREGTIAVSGPLTDLLLRATDVVRELLAAARAGAAAPAHADGVLAELRAFCLGEGQTALTPAVPANLSASHTFRIRFRPSAEIFAQGMDPLLVLRELSSCVEKFSATVNLERLPSLFDLEPDTCYLGWDLRFETTKSTEELRDVFAFVEDGAEISIVVEENAKADESAAALPPAPVRETTSLRVETAKVDKLIDLVGELVIAQSMATDIMRNFSIDHMGALREAVASMERYTRELQERVMGVRMLPIGHIFSRFPRLVRDVAAQLGKTVRLDLVGEETELDKGVVEQIGDPLTHLIRNAIDHGIESPEERQSAGKPEQSVIQLRAFHQGGSVIVEVSDDGRGLNAQRIRQKAIERGLIAAGEELSEERIHNLIFEPGFSTAESVSDLSGRGVGLDVVKRNVKALNGSVALSTAPGRGTTVRIKLPLTLAIMDGLLLRAGAETYILPLVSILESIRPRPEQVKTVAGEGEVIVVREEALPMLRLYRLFGIPGAVTEPSRGLTVLIENGGQQLALLVDELLGQQQVVVKSLETNYQKVEGALGATILGDGRAALILDVAGLAAIAHRRCADLAA